MPRSFDPSVAGKRPEVRSDSQACRVRTPRADRVLAGADGASAKAGPPGTRPCPAGEHTARSAEGVRVRRTWPPGVLESGVVRAPANRPRVVEPARRVRHPRRGALRPRHLRHSVDRAAAGRNAARRRGRAVRLGRHRRGHELPAQGRALPAAPSSSTPAPPAASPRPPSPRTPAGSTPGRSAGSTPGSMAAGSRMRPSPPTSPDSTTWAEPRRAPRRRWPRRASGPALPESRARPGNAPPGSSPATGGPRLPAAAGRRGGSGRRTWPPSSPPATGRGVATRLPMGNKPRN